MTKSKEKPIKMKIKNKAKKAKAGVRKQATSRALTQPRNPTFGNISTINTAPVAIGNSISGFKATAIPVSGGMRVVGRDFGFTPVATGTVTSWCLTGGMPLTPACMPTTILKNFCQMYNKFKFNKIVFHYITSSSTSSTGDVVFYYNKTASSSGINPTANTFLPYVLSDAMNVIGPQWTNHSMAVTPSGGWKVTDYGLNSEVDMMSQGDFFLYSKTSTTESPGYVIMDYDISFSELSLNPRQGVLPAIAAQWNQFALTFTAAVTAAVSVVVPTSSSTAGLGGTTITAFAGNIGDIYKLQFDITNSTFTVGAASTFFDVTINNLNITTNLTDGYTLYYVLSTTTLGYFYASLEAACANNAPLLSGATLTQNVVLRGFGKLVGQAALNLRQSSL